LPGVGSPAVTGPVSWALGGSADGVARPGPGGATGGGASSRAGGPERPQNAQKGASSSLLDKQNVQVRIAQP